MLLEALALQLVRDEYLALLRRQLVQGALELFEDQPAAHERGIRSGVGGWQEVCDAHHLPIVGHDHRVAEALGLPAAEQIGDAIARHLEQPAGDVIDRHQPPVGLDELRRRRPAGCLRRPAALGTRRADEAAQPGLFPLDDADDAIGPFHEGGDALLYAVDG